MELNDVLDYLNSIKDINEGGCGISALAIYRWLKQKNDDSHLSIMYLYSKFNWNAETYYVNNEKRLRNGDGRLCVPSHVVVLYNGKCYDSGGEVYIVSYRFIQNIPNDSYLVNTINNPEMNEWNDTFVKNNDIISEIEEKLGINLSDIKI